MDFSKFICPICGKGLHQEGSSLKCEKGHCFDVAKEGYVNLLPPNFKKSQLPGDNKIMVNARHAFLTGGYFTPLATELAELLRGRRALLDAGCGTGWYGATIKSVLSEEGEALAVYGIDISKFATARAAREGEDGVAVGSVFHLPTASGAFDSTLTVFAPTCADELYRVTQTDAIAITVNPAEKHLLELKKAMYGEATYENPPENAQKPLVSSLGRELFAHVKTIRLTFTDTVKSNTDIMALLSMTPYYYKTNEEKKQRLSLLTELPCTFDFYVDVYKRS